MVVLTLAGHTAGRGTIDPLGLAAVAALATGLAATTSRRRLTWTRTWLLLLAGQALMHMVLTFTSNHAHATAATSARDMVLGHVLASVLAAAVLVRADALIRCWAAYLAAVIGAAVPSLVHSWAPSGPIPDSAPHSTPALIRIRHRVVRRGPPALVTSAAH